MPEAPVNFTKERIETFLRDIQKYIGERVADSDRVESTVKALAKKTKGGTNLEAAFVDEFVLKNVKTYLAQHESAVLGDKSPRSFILAESVPAKKELAIACWTPAKQTGHPFYKSLRTNPRDLYLRWSGKDRKARKTPFVPVCPDLALLAPYRVVFECKYFNQRATQPAVLQLVEGLYEAFFYRALPTFEPGVAGLKYGWNYEYACFLAYDATPNRRLEQAWKELKQVRGRFWAESNIFVMILPLDESFVAQPGNNV